MALAGKPRGEYAKSAERREEILRAGVEVFASSGFRSGSLREVAERVGMSQAGLLHHFASKNDLLEAVLDRRDDDALARMGGSELHGLDMIRSLVELVEYNETTPGLVAMYAVLSAEATAPDHPAHSYFLRRYAVVLRMQTEAFEEAAAAGELKPGVDPASAARTLVALMDGLQVQYLLDPVATPMAAEVRAYVQSLLTVDL